MVLLTARIAALDDRWRLKGDDGVARASAGRIFLPGRRVNQILDIFKLCAQCRSGAMVQVDRNSFGMSLIGP
jgi:hypothetical protein